MLNKIGPNTEPYETSAFDLCDLDLVFSIKPLTGPITDTL